MKATKFSSGEISFVDHVTAVVSKIAIYPVQSPNQIGLSLILGVSAAVLLLGFRPVRPSAGTAPQGRWRGVFGDAVIAGVFLYLPYVPLGALREGGDTFHTYPFFVIVVACVAADAARSMGFWETIWRTRWRRVATTGILGLAVAAYAWPLISFVGWQTLHRRSAGMNQPLMVAAMGCWVEANTRSDDRVLAFFTYAVPSSRRYMPDGWAQPIQADYFWLEGKRAIAEWARFPTKDDVRRWIRDQEIAVVLLEKTATTN